MKKYKIQIRSQKNSQSCVLLRCVLLQKYLFYGWFLPNSGIILHPWIDHFHTHAKSSTYKKIPLVPSVKKYTVKKGSQVSRLQPGCH